MQAIGASERFILLSAQEPGADSRDHLARAGARVHDWTPLVDLAGQHRVLAYVHRAIAEADIAPPPAARDQLSRSLMTVTAQTMALDAALAGIAHSLDREGLRAIALKGPALARTLYPSAAYRPYGDLDLTIHAADEAAVVAALTGQGMVEIACGVEQRGQAHAGHVTEAAPFHRIFSTRDETVTLDLHLDPLQLGLRPVCEAERWQRARPLPGLPALWMLSPEDQLVHLSVHALKHGFDRLIWLKDIDLLLRHHHTDLDWGTIRAVATREGAAAAVWYTLELCRRLLGAPSPGSEREALKPSLLIKTLYRRVWPVSAVANLDGRMKRRAVQFHAADNARGILPSLVLMGRRRERARAALRYIIAR